MLAKSYVNSVYVFLFDYSEILARNSTIINKIKDQFPGRGRPDAVIDSIGGNSFFLKVIPQVVKKNQTNIFSVLAIKTKIAKSSNKSLEKSSLIIFSTITGITKLFGAIYVAKQTFCLTQDFFQVKSIVFTNAKVAIKC